MQNKTLFSSNDVSQLRQRAEKADDPMSLLAAFASLRIKSEFTFCAYPYRVFEGGVGNVWVVPKFYELPDAAKCETIDLFELPRPFPVEGSCMDGLTISGPAKLPRPPEALDNVMEAIEGDGTPYSYLSASIFAREIAEFGAEWHGMVWSFHEILDGDPWTYPHDWRELEVGPSSEQEWQWLDNKPTEWNTSIVCNGEVITVKFFTYSGIGQEAIYCYTDTYRRNDYKFEWDVRKIAYGGMGIIM